MWPMKSLKQLRGKSLNPPSIRNKEGYSGKKEDSLGRTICFQQGTRVPCAGGVGASGSDKPKTEQRQEKSPTLFNEQEMKLPTVVSQPVPPNAGYEGIAEKGQKANDDLQHLIDKGKGIGAQLGFQTIQPKTEEEMTQMLSEGEGGFVVLAPIKSQKRATEKVAADYGGDWSRLLDIARASIAVDTVDEVQQVIDKMRANGVELAKQPKDRINNPLPSGYRDILTNIRLPNGIIAELQIHLKPILKAKGAGHKHYEIMREIDGKMKMEGRTQRTPEEQKEYERAAAESKRIYDEAWAKAQGQA